MTLMGYELKKMLTKRGNQIVLLLLVLLVAYTCNNTMIQVEWIDQGGNPITGNAAAVKLRQESEEWTGTLDQSLLEKALGRLKEIYSTTPQDLRSGENNWLLRYELQGIGHIADLLGLAYGDEYETFEEMVNGLQAEDLLRFYDNRLAGHMAFLYEEGNWGYSSYTEEEKQYIMEQHNSVPTPFKVGYQEGWVQASEQIPSLMKYCIILLSFLLAGIFADEFAWKTDAVYYNTYHGRTKSTIIKLLLGFLTITLVYWLCMGSFSFVVFHNLGTDGADNMLQSYPGNWSIRYDLTFRQLYCLILGSGYIGFLLMGFLIMWISAKTKSSVLAVLTPSVILLIPMFLHEIYSLFLRKVIGLLPHWLFDIGQALRYQYLYKIGDQVTCLVPIILVLYSCLTLLLVFLCYWEYRYKQVT